MIFKREREKKFIVQGGFSFAEVDKFLSLFLPDADVETGSSPDYFWPASNADFIRVRGNTGELTVKKTDKSTIEDRIEENIKGKVTDLIRWAHTAFGESVCKVEKTYKIYYDRFAIISLYTVSGWPELFLEIEAENLSTVSQFEASLKQIYDLKQEMRSLYQIAMERKDEET